MNDGCTCGCGKTRSQVVREIMTTCTVNEEQADAMFDEGNLSRSGANQ